jgi:hypothetical protein
LLLGEAVFIESGAFKENWPFIAIFLLGIIICTATLFRANSQIILNDDELVICSLFGNNKILRGDILDVWVTKGSLTTQILNVKFLEGGVEKSIITGEFTDLSDIEVRDIIVNWNSGLAN